MSPHQEFILKRLSQSGFVDPVSEEQNTYNNLIEKKIDMIEQETLDLL